jgi:DNA-binding transcriptional ArsR family regulator
MSVSYADRSPRRDAETCPLIDRLSEICTPSPFGLRVDPGSEDCSLSASLTGKQTLAYAFAVADVFKALADPTRRAILDELLDRDGQTLFELCSRLASRHGLGSTRQAVSQHLDVLEVAGLVTTARQSRYKFHHLDTAPLHVIVERWLPSHRGDRS